MTLLVIGAGLAGLTAAYELEARGNDVVVLEASCRVGGRVWSEPLGDVAVVERGAEFVLPGATALGETIERLGLPLAPKGTPYGNREPRGGSPVTTTQLQQAGATLPDIVRASRTVAEALARLQPAVAAALQSRIEISCTYRADDLEATELLAATSNLGDFETHTVVGGNGRIADSLAAALASPVRLDSQVTALTAERDGVTAQTPAGPVHADAAVVAVPARVIDDITFEPPLPETKHTRSLRFGHAAKLFVRLTEPVPPSATLAVPHRFWCYTQLRPDGSPLPVLGALAGSGEALDALDVDSGPERWLETISTLRPDLPLDTSEVKLVTWHDVPHIRALQVARSVQCPMDDDELARPSGPLAFAGEHTAGANWHGTMEGAIRSGRRATHDILEILECRSSR